MGQQEEAEEQEEQERTHFALCFHFSSSLSSPNRLEK
jgi:hypothetical protein